VTLGGTSLETGKRHPTLGDGVIVGANAATARAKPARNRHMGSEMALLKIARMGHPVLRTRAREVEDPTDPSVRALVRSMI
ncbi:hypothetical protein SB754_22525, partial [Leifsonia sp. SIMBA_070]